MFFKFRKEMVTAERQAINATVTSKDEQTDIYVEKKTARTSETRMAVEQTDRDITRALGEL